jgi:hypothetical protein
VRSCGGGLRLLQTPLCSPSHLLPSSSPLAKEPLPLNWASSLARDELGIVTIGLVTIGLVTYVSQHHQRRRRHLHAASCECEFLRECFGHFALLELSSVGEFSCFWNRPLLERDLFWGHADGGHTMDAKATPLDRRHQEHKRPSGHERPCCVACGKVSAPSRADKMDAANIHPPLEGAASHGPLPSCAGSASMCCVPSGRAMCCGPPLAEPTRAVCHLLCASTGRTRGLVCAVCHVLCASITVGLAAI